jgi:hypothetical protein
MNNLFALDKETAGLVKKQILSETPNGMLQIVIRQMSKEYRAAFGQPLNESVIWDRVIWLVFEAKKTHGSDVALQHLPFWLFSAAIKCAGQSMRVIQRLREKIKKAYRCVA